MSYTFFASGLGHQPISIIKNEHFNWLICLSFFLIFSLIGRYWEGAALSTHSIYLQRRGGGEMVEIINFLNYTVRLYFTFTIG
jgi:hypothetical protein